MNKHILNGILVGALFALPIVSIAVSDAWSAGGLALLASANFGIAADACIGGLIAANFAFAWEENEHHEALSNHHTNTDAPAFA